MLKLYLMEAEPLLSGSLRLCAQGLVERERSARIGRMRQERAQAASLAAGLLLAHAVLQEKEKRAGGAAREYDKEEVCPVYVSVEEAIAELQCQNPVETIEAPGGKPFLKDFPGLFFSLSHSGAYAACAVSDREVGLDIQQCARRVKPAAADRILHETEANAWEGLSKEEKDACFFRLWAAKEAYVKYTGEGLSKSFSVLLADWETGRILDTQSGESGRLYELPAPEGYALMACTGGKPVQK